MNRVTQVRLHFKLSQKEFAEKLGIYQPEVSRMESDKTKTLTPRQINLISEKFDISPEWLETGAGDMFKVKNLQMVVDISSPFYYALRFGVGPNTARAFERLCNATPEEKKHIEKIFETFKFIVIGKVLFGGPGIPPDPPENNGNK